MSRFDRTSETLTRPSHPEGEGENACRRSLHEGGELARLDPRAEITILGSMTRPLAFARGLHHAGHLIQGTSPRA